MMYCSDCGAPGSGAGRDPTSSLRILGFLVRGFAPKRHLIRTQGDSAGTRKAHVASNSFGL